MTKNLLLEVLIKNQYTSCLLIVGYCLHRILCKAVITIINIITIIICSVISVIMNACHRVSAESSHCVRISSLAWHRQKSECEAVDANFFF